ncbi:acidic mammalian chitinase-like [Xyrauchen texanus]|uniref:acidic mammalian chitinase-like n=1 Tax=Xyrauchen texanus TaxID=154827 RepID=UPI002242A76B|nr:acidic mammalian chitinase-like [Xyrauchen texanus]
METCTNLCTHLIYAFAIINYANKIAGSEWNDVALYSTFNPFIFIKSSIEFLRKHTFDGLDLRKDYALQYQRVHGAPVEKLLMGFATYGRSFTYIQRGVGAHSLSREENL